jgi:hypothetical protein
MLDVDSFYNERYKSSRWIISGWFGGTGGKMCRVLYLQDENVRS